MKNKNTLVLAHYYCSPEVQQLADFVGDSLELSLRAKESKAERIVFAGVKFMAETAKIINPQAEVIIPDIDATCSLVTQVENLHTSIKNSDPFLYSEINLLKNISEDTVIVTYINSDYRLKALSDVIVTSANVEDIIDEIITKLGGKVFFTPDRNMGAYLKFQHPEWGDKFSYYTLAVCEVHDKFKVNELKELIGPWHNYPPVVLAHPESPLPILKMANLVGSTRKMLEYVENTKGKGIIYVATEEGLLYNMRQARPDLDIRLAPTYTGCQCNACPYMKKNTVDSVMGAIYGNTGTVIDYIPEDVRRRAKLPIEIMLKWQQQ